MTPVILIIVLASGFRAIEFLMFSTVIVGSFFIAGLAYFARKKRRNIHIEYLSSIPPGIIPIEEREGYLNYEVKDKLQTYKRRTSGIIPPDLYHGLKGNWMRPVLSLEQMTEIYSKFSKKLKVAGVILSLIGIGLILSVVWLFSWEFVIEHSEVFGIAIILILIGSLIFVMAIMMQNQYKEDATIETIVGWKTVGRKAAINAIEEFLKLNGEKYTKKKVSSQTVKSDTTPTYKYVFENGNYIQVQYIIYQSGMTWAMLGIGYTFLNYIQAKSLQTELDEFLAERDMIETL